MSVDPALAQLERDVAVLRTWEELAEDEMPLAGDPLDDLILHARDLVDTLGLHAENGDTQ